MPGVYGYHPMGPSVECSLELSYPGLEAYSALLADKRALREALDGPFCTTMPRHERLRQQPSCHTQLFHGRLSTACLAGRNLTAAQLPCTRTLFIVAFPGSGTSAMAQRLQRTLRNTHTTLHEETSREPDVLVSWLSRTDVWRLARRSDGPANATCGLAVEESVYSHYRWTRNRHQSPHAAACVPRVERQIRVASRAPVRRRGELGPAR